jgi:hypothetical protein
VDRRGAVAHEGRRRRSVELEEEERNVAPSGLTRLHRPIGRLGRLGQFHGHNFFRI